MKRKIKPRIISFDLEVSPALGYFYPPTWETGVLKTVERQKLLNFAWQVVGEKRIHVHNLSDMDGYEEDPKDDKKLVEKLHEVLGSADILLGQNSDRFDIPMANYFFIMNGLDPITKAKYIDTRKVAKRHFRFLNNTLDNLGAELGVGGKSEATYKDLWAKAFLESDKKSWKLLDKYCKRDVDITTKVYLKMRPFMWSHPSLSRITGEFDSCPRCGSYDYQIKAYRTNNTSKYTQYKCNHCRGYFTDRNAISVKEGDVKPKFKV